ncbi:hypothetical protein [Kutzneria sp. NPDC052558]|uniref:hypothetical protein n=1 Tax=Kutzneria sp. NPDC052558 TaxID=3364121 RepID=UPI0037C679AA
MGGGQSFGRLPDGLNVCRRAHAASTEATNSASARLFGKQCANKAYAQGVASGSSSRAASGSSCDPVNSVFALCVGQS